MQTCVWAAVDYHASADFSFNCLFNVTLESSLFVKFYCGDIKDSSKAQGTLSRQPLPVSCLVGFFVDESPALLNMISLFFTFFEAIVTSVDIFHLAKHMHQLCRGIGFRVLTPEGAVCYVLQSSLTAKAQRKVIREIKTARTFGLMPFTSMGRSPFRFLRSRLDDEDSNSLNH